MISISNKRSRRLYSSLSRYYNFLHHLQTLWADNYHRGEVAARISPCCGVILEIGCGTGLYTKILNERFPNSMILGIDHAFSMLLEQKRLRFRLAGNVFPICADAECLPLRGGIADCITSTYGLGGIANLSGTISEIHRVLRPEGILCIGEMTGVPDSVHPWLSIIHKLFIEKWIKYFWEFRDIDIRELIMKGGFRILEVNHYRNRILGSMTLIKAVKDDGSIEE